MRKYIKNCLLLLLTVAACFYVITIHTIAKEGNGPYWYFNNADPSYAFLMSSLCLADLEKTKFTYHPGVTPLLIGSATMRAMHAVQDSGKTLASSVVDDPERYIAMVSNVFLVLYLATFVGLSIYTIFYVRNMFLTLCVLVSPFVRRIDVNAVYPDFFGFSCESAIPFLMNLLLLAIVVTYRHSRQNSIPPQSVSALTGVLAVAGTLNKVPLAPAFLLLFLLQAKENRRAWLLAALISFIVLGVPLFVNAGVFFEFVGGIVRNTGIYGSGQQGVIKLSLLAENFIRYIREMPLPASILFVAIIVLFSTMKGEGVPERTFLFYLVLVFLSTLFMVLKHYAYRYFIVLNYLTPMLAFFSYKIVKDKIKGINKNILHICAILMLLIFPYKCLPVYPAADARSRDVRKVFAYINDAYPDLDWKKLISTLQVSTPANALAFGNGWAGGAYLAGIMQRFPDDIVYYMYDAFRGLDGRVISPEALPPGPLLIWGLAEVFNSDYAPLSKTYEASPQLFPVTGESFKNLTIKVLHIEGSLLLGEIVGLRKE